MEKNKVEIDIGGHSYTLIGRETKEYLNELGKYVDEKIHNIMSSNGSLGVKDASILTAFNIADELFKLREDYKSNKQELEIQQQVDKLLEENLELKKENDELKKQSLENSEDGDYKQELQQAYDNISNLLLERDKMLEELAAEKEKNTNLHFSLVELKSSMVKNDVTLQ